MLHAVIVNGNQQKLIDRYAKRHEFSFPIDNVTDLDLRRSECISAVKHTDEVFWDPIDANKRQDDSYPHYAGYAVH